MSTTQMPPLTRKLMEFWDRRNDKDCGFYQLEEIVNEALQKVREETKREMEESRAKLTWHKIAYKKGKFYFDAFRTEFFDGWAAVSENRPPFISIDKKTHINESEEETKI